MRKSLVAYQRPDEFRSVIEILVTVVPLLAIWGVAWWLAATGAWGLALLLAVPAAGFIVRLFAIQHDCGHRSFFASAALNDWVGRAIGVVTLTPFDCWRREHAMHHTTSGDLDHRGAGSIVTLTVDEYRALPPMRRLGYRLYRHPAILFLVGPLFVFFIQQRLPVGLMREGWRPWVSAMGTNVVLAAALALAIWTGVWREALIVFVPSVLLGASIGVWLFYVQHQFEDGYWARRDAWNHTEAALKGSSHYDLPQPFRWLTANIGIHHVHHIASRIPFYRLPAVLKHHPALKQVGRLTFLKSLTAVKLTLWDEAAARLVSFRESSGAMRRLDGSKA